MWQASPDRIVILGSGITALAVARDARRLGLRPLLFDTEAGIAMASRQARTQLHAGPRDAGTLCRLLMLGREQPSLLIATADEWLRFLCSHRLELQSAFAHILHPANDTLAICLDKQKFADWCQAHALRTPRRFQPGELARLTGELPCPLLLRPAETQHMAPLAAVPKAREVKSRSQLQPCLEEFARAGVRAVVTESLLDRPLRQYSIGFARRDGQTLTVVARKLRPLPQACAAGSLVETVLEPALDALGQHVARQLDYYGIGEIEVLRDMNSGEDFLIEVNARPWLQFALGQAAGRDLLGFITSGAHAACGNSAPAGARWLDLRADLRTCFGPDGLVPTGQLGAAAWLHSVAGANLFAHWSWRDQRPFWRDLRDLLTRRAGRGAAGPGKTRAAGSAAAHHWPASPRPAADWKNSSGWE